MAQLQHISFKNWNTLGKPTGNLNANGHSTKGKNTENTAKNIAQSKATDVFGEAATIELSDGHVKEKSTAVMMASASKASTRTLKVGCKGNDVAQLQKNLNSLGYNAGQPDGNFGNGTKNAVISFQKTYGLSPDGIAGKNTLTAISTTLNRKNNNILSKGQVSNDVKNLQNNLISLGFLAGKADGAFGKNTESAVIAFQKKYGLTQDGLVGKATKAKIADVLNKNNQTAPVTPPKGDVKKISNGQTMALPKPGETITVSLGTDKPSIKAKVAPTNAWSIEYSINGCKKVYGENALCTKRLNSAISKFEYNSGEMDLLKLQVPGFGTCYAGAMVEGFGEIGDIAEITLDDGTKFNFMLLDTKSTTHKSKDLSSNNQCQNKYGHGYMQNNNTQVQLSVCEFITSQSQSGISSAKKYPSGNFLDERYVASAKIIGHVDIE